MSIAYFSWALSDKDTRLAARLVLFVLGDMAQDHTFPESETDDDAPVWHGICWPSAKTIGRGAHVGRSQVFAALAKLEELGLIRTVPADVHQLVVMGRPVKTPIRQLAGPTGFKRLPCESSGPVQISDGSGNQDGGGSGNPDTNRNKEQEEGEADASPSKSGGFSSKYLEPETPGAAGAPWLTLELALLMRDNDSKAKLPPGLRPLMAPEYVMSMRAGARVGSGARRELLAPVLDQKSTLDWLDPMRLLIDADEREPREVAQVLRWCQGNDFWKGNILSPSKFRKQYPQLRAKWLEQRVQGAAAAPEQRQPTTKQQLDALTRRREED